MIGWLAELLVRRGHSGARASALAPYIAGAGALALLAALAGLWLHFHDRRVVAKHEAAITAAVARATTAAETSANANEAVRATERVRAAQDNQGAIDDAERTHPAEVRAAAGPAVNGVAERLRQHGSARHP